jgi:hypothetical protein
MTDAISPISTSAGGQCQTVDVAGISVAGEVRSPMSGSGKGGEQLDRRTADPYAVMTGRYRACPR